jgi:NodT family efflux transporter outer membrane factor (OMF) lipoprotein
MQSLNVTTSRIARRLALLAGLLAGCMVGPDYHPPNPKIPAHFLNPSAPPSTQTSATSPQPVEVAQWWHHFNDPELDSLVCRAVDANLDLRQATSRLRQARAELGVAASALYPQATANGSYTRSGTGNGGTKSFTSKKGRVVTESTSTKSEFYIAGFDASWEIDVFGGERRGVESADANITAAIEDRRDVLVTLLAEVATDYVALRQYQLELAIAQENLASDQHIEALTREKFGAGFAAQLDVANAAAEVAATESQIPTFETSARQEIYALSILLDRDPGALVQELSQTKPIPLTPPRVPIGLPSDLIFRRPDIRRSDALFHAATANVGVATAQLYPQFSLTGDLNIQSSRFSGLGNWANNVWQFGPSVTWPIFTAGRLQAQVEVQNALQEQALLTYDQAVLTALSDVENALIAYANEQQRRAALVDSVQYNRQALDLSTRLYNAGLTEFLNVLTAERSLYGAEDSLAQSQGAVASDLAALYKALGGGWEIDPDAVAYPPPPATQPAVAPALINQAATQPPIAVPTH